MKNKDWLASLGAEEHEAFFADYDALPFKQYIDMAAWLESDNRDWIFAGDRVRLKDGREGVRVKGLPEDRCRVVVLRDGRPPIMATASDAELRPVLVSSILSASVPAAAPGKAVSPAGQVPDGAEDESVGTAGRAMAAMPAAQQGKEAAPSVQTAIEPGRDAFAGSTVSAVSEDVPSSYKGHRFTEEERKLLDAGLSVRITGKDASGEAILLSVGGQKRKMHWFPAVPLVKR